MTQRQHFAELDDRQIQAAILFLARKSNGLTAEDVAKAVGVSRRTLYTWTKLPAWRDFSKNHALEVARESLPDVMAVLLKNCMAGSTKSIEVYLKALGVLGGEPKVEITNTTVNEDRSTEALERDLEELRRMLDDDTLN